MLAAVFNGPKNMEIKAIATPEIAEDELLLKVKACAICGTDLRIYNREKTRDVRTPSILGHEISGEVFKVGTKVANYKQGERVAIAPVLPCGKCFYCKNTQENICLNRKAFGYEYDGGFAEYIKIPSMYLTNGNVNKISNNISFEEACLAEPLACVLNGIERVNIKPGDTVVIVGAGPIGLMHLILAGYYGAGKIIISEVQEERRNLAEKLGADLVVNPDQADLKQIVLAETQGLGADSAILTIGKGVLINYIITLLKKGSRLNLFGGYPQGEKSEIDPNLIHYNEIWITGASACTINHYQKALALITDRKINLKPLISHKYSLRQIDKAFETVINKNGIKVVIKNE